MLTPIVFDLPNDIVNTLELKSELNSTVHSAEPTEATRDAGIQRPETPEGTPTSATSCALCTMTFATVQEQRNHVRSDLHGYNLKQKMRGLRPVGEKDFETLVGELDESISGSDSESEESSEDDADIGSGKKKDTTLTALLKKQANIADTEGEVAPKKRKRGGNNPPLLWFSSSKLPPNVSLGIYRSIFTPAEQLSDSTTLVQTVQRKQLSPKPPPTKPTSEVTEESGGVPLPRELQPNTSATGPHYFLCMIGGGHFAGMLVSLTPKMTRKAGVEDRAATVLAHKTFHRYTTRRKQGGSQAANDSAKGAAHSAGSSLRRYNETALTSEVRSLLSEWKEWIDTSELLFIRASGTTSRRTLFGPYEKQVLSANDTRIRGFPFSTKRATQAELMRAFVELTRVKVSTVDEVALAKKAQEEAEAVQRAEDEAKVKSVAPQPTKPKMSKEDEEATLHTTQIQALIRRSKAPALISYIQSNNLPPNFTLFPTDTPQNHHAPTPLHLASSSNAAACVTALLLKAKADPTVKSLEGKTAFEIAGDRATRDAFRIARSELGEGAFDWETAGVPAALSKAEADQRAERERAETETEKAAEAQRRKEELEKLRRQEQEKEDSSKERKYGKGRSIVSVEKTAQEKREEEARGMTPEMRMKLERERRARAAEARFAKK
ncbi:hypothetical protein MBLNU457_6596t1 [Dothideomycetes sp. NU457]